LSSVDGRSRFGPLAGAAEAPRFILWAAVIQFVWGVLCPRAARRSRWPTRLSPRGLLLYAAVRAVLLTLLQVRFASWLERLREGGDRAAAALREELGRVPTEEEIVERLTRSS
jgi:protein-S-isoprenylcysteine O-methyltransferase Ste14